MALDIGIPNIFVIDFAQAHAYDTGPLGFRTLFTWGAPPNYAHVVCDGVKLVLRHVDRPVLDHAAGVDLLSAFIEMRGVDALFTEMQSAGASVHQAPRDEPWGVRDFIVRDPDGNLLCFGEDV